MKYDFLRPEHRPLPVEFKGFWIRLVQAGPEEFVAVVERPYGEEVARTPKYLDCPYTALRNALEALRLGQVEPCK